MAVMIGSHEVSDYDKWLGAMQGAAPADGRQSLKIFRTPDSQRIVVMETFDTMENAEKHLAFLENPENRPMGESIGVVFPITVWIVEEI